MRWLNPDPDWQIDGLNLYRMVRNNPIGFIDKMGKSPTRKVFDGKDVEGLSSIFSTIRSGLEKNNLNPEKTLYILVGRSPLVLGAYIEKNGFEIANLQISGMAGGLEIMPISGLDESERAHRLSFLDSALGGKSAGVQSVVVIDEGISGSSAFAATNLVKEYFASKESAVVTKMATISQRINDSRFTEEEQKFLHHEDNLLFETPLDTATRGVRRYIKLGTAQVDKGLAYVEKFNYAGMDSGLIPSGIDTKKKAALDTMMSTAIEQHGMNPPARKSKKVGGFAAGNASVAKYNRKNAPSFLMAVVNAFSDPKFGLYKMYG
jgi:insecticidal toxin complex protein TccC